MVVLPEFLDNHSLYRPRQPAFVVSELGREGVVHFLPCAVFLLLDCLGQDTLYLLVETFYLFLLLPQLTLHGLFLPG